MNTKPIKRYGNRKLYNPNTGKYVTLKELLTLPDIKVIDGKTNKDITQLTILKAKQAKELMEATCEQLRLFS